MTGKMDGQQLAQCFLMKKASSARIQTALRAYTCECS